MCGDLDSTPADPASTMLHEQPEPSCSSESGSWLDTCQTEVSASLRAVNYGFPRLPQGGSSRIQHNGQSACWRIALALRLEGMGNDLRDQKDRHGILTTP